MRIYELDEICANCGFTYGSHRGDMTDFNACPGHEGQMDWSQGLGTHWAPIQVVMPANAVHDGGSTAQAGEVVTDLYLTPKNDDERAYFVALGRAREARDTAVLAAQEACRNSLALEADRVHDAVEDARQLRDAALGLASGAYDAALEQARAIREAPKTAEVES